MPKTKTPTPLEQARREKREAKAIKQFVKGYSAARRGQMTDGERAMIRDMLKRASVRVQVADDALAAALKAGARGYQVDDNGTGRVMTFAQVLERARA